MNKITFSWNLSELYADINDPKIEENLAEVGKQIAKVGEWRGKIATMTPRQIFELLEISEKIAVSTHKIGLFAGLLEDIHVNQPEYVRFTKLIEEKLIALGQELIFVEVEFSQLSEKKWQEILKSLQLKKYSYTLKKMYEQAKRTLSEPEEKILAEKSQTSSGALGHMFAITTDTLEIDWRDKKITLEEALALMRAPEQSIRKAAATAIHTALKTNDKTTPAIYNSLVQDKAISARLRKYDFPEQARYEADDVEKETVEAMINAVRASDELVSKYYGLKKKLLGLDSLYWWDRYAPLPAANKEYSIGDGQKIVEESLSAFSPRFSQMATELIKSGHIDWLPSPIKHGGAYCAGGTRELKPFVLLNWTGKADDVMTLAHELGHAIHDIHSLENNTFSLAQASLAMAEIASTFCEELVFQKLIAEASKEEKIALLMATIEDNFATIHRQVTMFQFEQKIHQSRAKEGELSKEQIDNLWHATMKAPFGESVKFTDEHKNFWMYIPHIINSPFYVYSYAFAQLCTLSLIAIYKKRGSAFVKTYVDILSAGGSDSPKNILAKADLDISSPDFWHNGLKLLENYIDELESLI